MKVRGRVTFSKKEPEKEKQYSLTFMKLFLSSNFRQAGGKLIIRRNIKNNTIVIIFEVSQTVCLTSEFLDLLYTLELDYLLVNCDSRYELDDCMKKGNDTEFKSDFCTDNIDDKESENEFETQEPASTEDVSFVEAISMDNPIEEVVRDNETSNEGLDNISIIPTEETVCENEEPVENVSNVVNQVSMKEVKEGSFESEKFETSADVEDENDKKTNPKTGKRKYKRKCEKFIPKWFEEVKKETNSLEEFVSKVADMLSLSTSNKQYFVKMIMKINQSSLSVEDISNDLLKDFTVDLGYGKFKLCYLSKDIRAGLIEKDTDTTMLPFIKGIIHFFP